MQRAGYEPDGRSEKAAGSDSDLEIGNFAFDFNRRGQAEKLGFLAAGLQLEVDIIFFEIDPGFALDSHTRGIDNHLIFTQKTVFQTVFSDHAIDF